MTNKSITQSISPQRIDQAILSELRGEADFEGRTPADFLINEIQSSSGAKGTYVEAAIKAAAAKAQSEDGWWVVFERIIALCEIASPILAGVLEQRIHDSGISTGDDRASIYSILDLCGKPQPAYVIEGDQLLYKAAPLRWLDLMLLRVPNIEDGQNLVLSAIKGGYFGVVEFRYRLEEMRALGGKKLGNWLRAIRSALPSDEVEAYDQLVDSSFGLKEAEGLKVPRQDESGEFHAVITTIIASLEQALLKGTSPRAAGTHRRLRTHRVVGARDGGSRHEDVGNDVDRGIALNIPRIQHTKQLASMSI